MIELVRQGGPALAEQIASGIAALVQRGALADGARLPSVRQMAERLEVSAFTVIAGYDKLVARHLLVSRPGAGYFVVGPRAARDAGGDFASMAGDPADPLGFAMQAIEGAAAGLRSSSGFLPEEWLADVVPAGLLARVAKGRNAMRAPAPVQGSLGLRRQLADRLQSHGIPASPGQIITTIGASHAFDLLLRTLLRPGDTVAVEDPGYMVLFAQIRALDLHLVPVPRRQDGPDLDALEDVVKAHRPKIFFTQTLLQNPTGGSTSAAKCHRLLLLAERHGFDIVEDDVYGDIAGPGATRLAALDELRRVYHVSSFTKLLSPALRVGYMAVPRSAVDRLVAQKVLGVIASPGLTEALVEAVLDSGRYQRHTHQLRGKFALFRQRAQLQLAEAGIELGEPGAEGMFIWGRLPGLTDADALVREALAAGILLAKGSMFSPSGGCADHLRFNVAHSCDPALAEFLTRARRQRTGAGAEVLPFRATARR